MNPFDAHSYGPVVAELLVEPRLMPLGPGTPNREVRVRLQALKAADLFPGGKVQDPDMAAACLAGLWLYHNFLDEAHAISQDLHTPTGSYWHGLMHRREPDAANAAYWFRRVGDHPIFQTLAQEAQKLGYSGRTDRWDPFAFIDRCEKYRESGEAEEETLCRVQLREWELLFAWCYRQAAGGA